MMQSDNISKSLQQIWLENPLVCRDALWPHVKFHEKQVEEIYSVRDNVETYVHAGNMLGKDFVAGFIVWWYWICHYSTDRTQQQVRILTTSVTANHLNVLWAEIAKFGMTSKLPILSGSGGPFVLTEYLIRHKDERDISSSTMNYVKGVVSGPDSKEALQGHHARYSLFLVDEASGIPDWVYEMGRTWFRRGLFFGNPLPTTNWWYRNIKAGDLVA